MLEKRKKKIQIFKTGKKLPKRKKWCAVQKKCPETTSFVVGCGGELTAGHRDKTVTVVGKWVLSMVVLGCENLIGKGGEGVTGQRRDGQQKKMCDMGYWGNKHVTRIGYWACKKQEKVLGKKKALVLRGKRGIKQTRGED